MLASPRRIVRQEIAHQARCKAFAIYTSALIAGLVAASTADADPRPLLSAHVPQTASQHSGALVGTPSPNQRLLLAVALPLRDEAGLGAFLRDLYDPANPS